MGSASGLGQTWLGHTDHKLALSLSLTHARAHELPSKTGLEIDDVASIWSRQARRDGARMTQDAQCWQGPWCGALNLDACVELACWPAGWGFVRDKVTTYGTKKLWPARLPDDDVYVCLCFLDTS